MGVRQSSRKSRGNRPLIRGAQPEWVSFSDEQLLDLRMCDLNLDIRDTWLQSRIDQLYEELERQRLRFRPHFWLSSEWFTPDGIPGVAIRFYLAHRRLMKLEEHQMLEVEGGNTRWCMQLLRHETGHAIDNAYRLRRRRKWQQTFGKSSVPYPQYYQPKPFSRRFVIHLDYWYAQSHPTEDFAETFAVWLGNTSSWRKRYRNWPALKKLQYVDELMQDIAGTRPLVNNQQRVEPLRQLKITLRQHYAEKCRRYGVEYPDFYERDLRRLFTDAPDGETREPAAAFLRRIRPKIRRLVAHWTGQYQYTIDQVLKDMITSSRELKLYTNRPEEQATLEAAILVSVQTMNYLHGGHHRIVL